MAITQRGIYYPNDYTVVSDIPSDMHQMAESVDEAIGNKVDKINGKGLSTNDYTTAEKIELSEVVTEIANAKSSTVKGVAYGSVDSRFEDIEADIQSIQELADLQEQVQDLQNNQLRESESGTSIDLNDSADSRVKSIGLWGNSVQETTTGKNLLNPYLSNTTTHGVTVTYDENTQEITLNGTCDEDNTTFIFTSTPEFNLPKNNNIYGLIKYISGQSNGFFSLRAFNNDYSVSIGVNTNNPINTDIIYNRTFSVDALFTLFSIRVDEGSTFDNLKIKLMLSKIDAVYEPYTNGVSPNPHYPQEIKSTGENGYITEKIVNKNLFDRTDTPWYNGTGLQVTSADKGIYNLNGTRTGNELRFFGTWNSLNPVWVLKPRKLQNIMLDK